MMAETLWLYTGLVLGFVLGWTGRKGMEMAEPKGWEERGALPEPAKVDRPTRTDRVTCQIGGEPLYVTTSMDSGRICRK